MRKLFGNVDDRHVHVGSSHMTRSSAVPVIVCSPAKTERDGGLSPAATSPHPYKCIPPVLRHPLVALIIGPVQKLDDPGA